MQQRNPAMVVGRDELPDYRAYMGRVRYRSVPGLW